MHPLAFDPAERPVAGINAVPDWAKAPPLWVDTPEEAAKPAPPKTFEWLRGRVAAVTGGAGIVGKTLALDLLAVAGCRAVRLLDLREPITWDGRDDEAARAKADGRLTFVKTDVTNEDDVEAALAGAQAVFHVASYGMSGLDMLNAPRIWAVNLGGTKNVVRGCLRGRVPVLVYTSSVNVCFGGQVVEGADEMMPYFPIAGHTEEYSKSKTAAESYVLEVACGQEFLKEAVGDDGAGKKLRACAVRPCAIYGEGEERHFPRILGKIKSGLVVFSFGSPKNRVDWVHVRNLAMCEMLAADRLGQELEADLRGEADAYPYRRVLGRKYFVSDNEPTNQFELLRPFFELYKYPFPSLVCIPLPFMIGFGYLNELFCNLHGGRLGGPFLTRAEVVKSGQNHWFRTDRARLDLGYEPAFGSREGMAKLAVWYAERDPDAKRDRSAWERWNGLAAAAAVALPVVLVLLALFWGVGVPILAAHLWLLKQIAWAMAGAVRAGYAAAVAAKSAVGAAAMTLPPVRWFVEQPEQIKWVFYLLPMPVVTWIIARENALRTNETWQMIWDAERRRAEHAAEQERQRLAAEQAGSSGGSPGADRAGSGGVSPGADPLLLVKERQSAK
ncbi:3-beta hydroxysteroid dehydrogenase/isomerase family-domain-containing protein [Hyaloraphidium curvatum]|nr:3-beta hydroxysteroid dehydrogenase/isomerase family-domain-containing protein [Hyaloraphidium curvatum]